MRAASLRGCAHSVFGAGRRWQLARQGVMPGGVDADRYAHGAGGTATQVQDQLLHLIKTSSYGPLHTDLFVGIRP